MGQAQENRAVLVCLPHLLDLSDAMMNDKDRLCPPREKHSAAVEEWVIIQFLFDRQWKAIRVSAASCGPKWDNVKRKVANGRNNPGPLPDVLTVLRLAVQGTSCEAWKSHPWQYS
jgi:hypothetical protein